jgi:hypothetical protein
MGLNLGLPCHHFFHIYTTVQGLQFNIGFIRARYEYVNATLI